MAASGFGVVVVILALLAVACTTAPAAPAGSAAVPARTAAPAAGAATSAPAAPAARSEPVTLTVGFIPSLAYAPFYVAYEKGYFRERGIELNLEPGGPGTITQVGAGQFQIAGFGFDAAYFNALARGIDVRSILPVAAVSAEEGSISPLVARKELWDSGAVRGVADLRGRRVAKSGTTVGAIQYTLDLGLSTGGLTLRDVELVEGLSFPDIVQALGQGAVDGAVLSEPFVTFAEDRGFAVVLSDRHDLGTQLNALAVNGAFARAQPDAVVDFAVAYLRGVRDLYGGGRRAPENVAIIEQYTKVPAATVVRTRQPYTDPNGEILVDSVLAMQRYVFANAVMEATEPFPADRLVDPTFARRAVAILGEFRP